LEHPSAVRPAIGPGALAPMAGKRPLGSVCGPFQDKRVKPGGLDRPPYGGKDSGRRVPSSPPAMWNAHIGTIFRVAGSSRAGTRSPVPVRWYPFGGPVGPDRREAVPAGRAPVCARRRRPAPLDRVPHRGSGRNPRHPAPLDGTSRRRHLLRWPPPPPYPKGKYTSVSHSLSGVSVPAFR